jgi:hypothetical protein
VFDKLLGPCWQAVVTRALLQRSMPGGPIAVKVYADIVLTFDSFGKHREAYDRGI